MCDIVILVTVVNSKGINIKHSAAIDNKFHSIAFRSLNIEDFIKYVTLTCSLLQSIPFHSGLHV